VEKSPLENFSIGTITDQAMCQELISSIPKMKVRTLQFGLVDSLERFSLGLLCAIKANASIYSVAGVKFQVENDEVVLRDFTDFFNNTGDHRKLKAYASRNKVSQLIANSSLVPREAWPKVLAAVRVTGPNAVYRILRVLGNSVGPVDGKRKRTRPIP
jgi:hypothetical protein